MMAERDKEEMELDIAKMEFDFKGTSVICRSGSPLILADLKKVRVLVCIYLLVFQIDHLYFHRTGKKKKKKPLLFQSVIKLF